VKLTTLHASFVEKIKRFGVRAAAREAKVNPMRVSRFCSANRHLVGRIPIEDWVMMAAVLAQLSGRAIEVPLSELDL
jgi:hypothetical protein